MRVSAAVPALVYRPGQQAAAGWETSKCATCWSGAGDAAAAAGCLMCCCRLVASAPCWLLLMAAGGPCTLCRTCCGQHDRLWHQADQPAPHSCEADDDEDPALNEHSSKRLLVGDLCVGGPGQGSTNSIMLLSRTCARLRKRPLCWLGLGAVLCDSGKSN